MKPLFEFADYRRYLVQRFEELSATTRGVRSRFAEALSCRPGFISQVLSGTMSLSADQAAMASDYLGHSDDEAEYFSLLIQRDRATAPALKQRLSRLIDLQRAKFLNLNDRLNVERKISREDELIFYSSWQYLAALTALTIPELRTKEAIAKKLDLPLKRVAEVLDYLTRLGLARANGSEFVPGETRTHLERSSTMVARHHQNWRVQAMTSIERAREQDFHYSSVISISREDRDRLRSLIIEFIENAAQLIGPSKEEELMALSLDLFEL